MSLLSYPSIPVQASTTAQTSVANATGGATLLAANFDRIGATIFNDDTLSTGATLKVKLGASSSSTSFTVAIVAQGYYELPYRYTGIVTGTATANSGNARITELTA